MIVISHNDRLSQNYYNYYRIKLQLRQLYRWYNLAYARNTAPADVFSEPYLVDGWIDGWMPEDLSRFPVASSAAAAAHTLEKNCNIVAKDVANPLRSPAARGSIVRPDPRSQAPPVRRVFGHRAPSVYDPAGKPHRPSKQRRRRR